MEILSQQYVVFSLIAITLFALYMAGLTLTRRNPVRERLKRVLPDENPTSGFSYTESKASLYVFCSNMLSAFGTDLNKAKEVMYLPMARAGLTSTQALVFFLFFKKFIQPLLIVLAVLLLIRLVSLGDDVPFAVNAFHILCISLLFVAGVSGAKIYLKNRIEKRQMQLHKSFPDALDLLLVCVESGLPLDSALARVCRELKRAHPMITQELDRTRIELNVLNDRSQALENLALRTDTEGFKTFTSTLIQTEKVGSSMSDMMRTLSEEYRTERMLYAENKAARIPALITIPLIFFIMPAFMLLLMGPPIVRIQQQGGLFPAVSQQPVAR